LHSWPFMLVVGPGRATVRVTGIYREGLFLLIWFHPVINGNEIRRVPIEIFGFGGQVLLPPWESWSIVLDARRRIRYHQLKFIKSFEELVHGAVSSLENLPTVEYVRIRFIDLDSACSLLNPYFQLVDNQCTGLWSVGILETLQKVRPNTHFIELADGIYPQYGLNNTIVGAIYPRNRPLSINANMYKIIADASKAWVEIVNMKTDDVQPSSPFIQSAFFSFSSRSFSVSQCTMGDPILVPNLSLSR